VLLNTFEGNGGAAIATNRIHQGLRSIGVDSRLLVQTRATDDRVLERRVSLQTRGLRPGTYELRHHRVDAVHSNIVRIWEDLGRPDWPDDAGWSRLRAADRLETLEPPRVVLVDRGHLDLAFELPMPAMSLIELVPIDHR